MSFIVRPACTKVSGIVGTKAFMGNKCADRRLESLREKVARVSTAPSVVGKVKGGGCRVVFQAAFDSNPARRIVKPQLTTRAFRMDAVLATAALARRLQRSELWAL